MFETVILDLTTEPPLKYENMYPDIDPREAKLFPFIYLIAEKVIEAGGEQIRREATNRKKADFIESTLLMHEGRPNFIDHIKNHDGVFFGASQNMKAQALTIQGLTAQNCVLVLAAAGLDVIIPNINIDIARSDEIQVVKEKLQQERMEYLHAITNMADETFDRLSEGYYKDTVDWALSEAFLKIKPKAEVFADSMRKLEKNLLRRLVFNILEDGIPTIGSVLVKKGFIEAGKKSVEVALKILCRNLAKRIEERKVPEVVYGYKVSKSIHV